MLLKELKKQIDAFIAEDPRNAEIRVIAGTEDDGIKHQYPPAGFVVSTTYDYLLSMHNGSDKVFVICAGKPVMYSRPQWWSNED